MTVYVTTSDISSNVVSVHSNLKKVYEEYQHYYLSRSGGDMSYMSLYRKFRHATLVCFYSRSTQDHVATVKRMKVK